jgi:hypothetical protein
MLSTPVPNSKIYIVIILKYERNVNYLLYTNFGQPREKNFTELWPDESFFMARKKFPPLF